MMCLIGFVAADRLGRLRRPPHLPSSVTAHPSSTARAETAGRSGALHHSRHKDHRCKEIKKRKKEGSAPKDEWNPPRPTGRRSSGER